MARDPESIAAALEGLLGPQVRGRLLARGLARGLVWRDGVVPEGGPAFPEGLTADLLDFGYGVLALALELRDANRDRTNNTGFSVNDAFRVAAEAIESACRRGDRHDSERGRHLVVAACSFHLGGFAARSFSLLTPLAEITNLSSGERALALLLRRQLVELRDHVIAWLGNADYGDTTVAGRLASLDDEFDEEAAAVLALSRLYHRALGFADSALNLGDASLYTQAIELLDQIVAAAADVGNIPMWWVATLTRHLLSDLWECSLYVRLPKGPSHGLPPRWDDLRRGFVQQLVSRDPPQIDLWPSQLEATARVADTRDDLVVALPTSAGKTRIAELCILRTLADERRIVYVTPLRALSAQVERTLARTFVPLGATVTSLYGAAGATTSDSKTLIDASIVVATPEKLDFALRQDPAVLDDVGLIVFDEGHMIGADSREIRYEVLIQRLLRRGDAATRRIVCLSAMFDPDDELFEDFGNWLRSDDPGSCVHVRWRPTRQLLATLDWQPGPSSARLSFIEGEKPFVPHFLEARPPLGRRRKEFPADDKEFCIATANTFARDKHNILVYSPQRSQIEPLVEAFEKAHRQGYIDAIAPPKSKHLEVPLAIAREWLGDDHPATKGLKLGIGAHHGMLPRPFLSAIEELLARRELPVVVASPTLAQGVDLACSVLVFRSIQRFSASAGRQVAIDASEFANVLGRAGRAFVDLDGIAVYPIFKTGRAHRIRLEEYRELIKASRKQRLISGLAILIHDLAKRIGILLQVSSGQLLEYVTNNRALWGEEQLADTVADEDIDNEEAERPLDDLLADLDVAILSLIERFDAPVEELATLLDVVLKDSLWSRTMLRTSKQEQELQREVLRSRAHWLWQETTSEQRRACFAAGLGSKAGVFLYERLDELVPLLADLHDAVVRADGTAAAAAAVAFAEVIAESSLGAKKLPPKWEKVLSAWVNGVAFADLLKGLKSRDKGSVLAFIQDSVVFKLVWAAEAVRVQATTASHPRSGDLGDGAALALTCGVPSLQAAVLCQSGYASRTGAVWLSEQLPADFIDQKGMRRWIRRNGEKLSSQEFWASADHRLLWEQMHRHEPAHKPTKWARATFQADVDWDGAAAQPGEHVRLVSVDANTVVVCAADLSPLGMTELPVAASGAFLDGVVGRDRRITVEYFGPEISR